MVYRAGKDDSRPNKRSKKRGGLDGGNGGKDFDGRDKIVGTAD